MEVIHEGYLYSNIGIPSGTGESNNLRNVYVVLSTEELVCYSENPALQHSSNVHIVGSFNLKYTRVADSTASKRPKSFEVFSTRDHSTVEFICPTNSVKFQWVKQLQVQTCSAAPSPSDRKVGNNTLRNGDVDAKDAEFSYARPTFRQALQMESSSPLAVSRLTASRNLAAKVLTPVPRISYNTSLLDRTSVRPEIPHVGNVLDVESPNRTTKSGIETHPKWIPGNFGNKQHSSLALAVGPPHASPRAQSADRSTRNASSFPVGEEYRPGNSGDREIGRAGSATAQPAPRSTTGNPTLRRAAPTSDYDVLASRAAPNRSKSATPTARSLSRNQRTVFDAQSPRSNPRHGNSATPKHMYATPSSAPSYEQHNDHSKYKGVPLASSAALSDPSSQLMAKSMSDMTVSEIRAALLSMPAMVRQSLVQTPSPLHGSQNTAAHPIRRGSYEDNRTYTPGNNQSNMTQNSASMTHEEYLEARRRHGRDDRNGEQYERFMGDNYPAVGEFYPVEHEREYVDERRLHRVRQEDHLCEESSAEEGEEDDFMNRTEGEEGEDEYARQRHLRNLYADKECEVEQEQRNRERYEYSAEQKYGQSYDTTASADATDDSDFPPPQEYGQAPHDDDDAGYRREQKERNHYQQRQPHDRRHLRSQGDNSPHRSNPPASGRSAQMKPQLPGAARRGGGISSPNRLTTRDNNKNGASDRESLIPRPTDTSPRNKKINRNLKTGPRQEETDDYDSSIAPSRGTKNSSRATSAQRVPGRNQRSHSPQPAWGSNTHSNNNSNSGMINPRAVSAGSVADSSRPRYLPEAERKQALEWSRKQAWEKKIRSDFSGSPLRAASPSGAAPVLKLKYRSFHSSVEKDTTFSVEEATKRNGHSQQAGRQTQGLYVETSDRPERNTKLSALEKDAAVQEAVGAIARSRARATMENQTGYKSEAKSEHINYSANAFSKKPESFFSFRNNRAGVSQSENKDLHSQHRTNEGVVRKASPPLKPRPTSTTPTAPSVPSAAPVGAPSPSVHLNQPLQQHARRSLDSTAQQSGVAGGPVLSSKRDDTMTIVAEWRRLTEWLTRIGMQRYIDVLRANGVTKLSLVELMVPDDMQQIGIAPEDIAVIHNKVTEFTNRTRSFSEQVLNRAGTSPSPKSDASATYPTAPILTAAPVPNASAPQTARRPAPQPVHPSTSGFTRPRPSQPPPHLLSQPPNTGRGGVLPVAPFAQRDQQMQSFATADAVELSDPEGRAEPVLESARIAAEEHIFSDVREIRSELLRCFETGERELFFHAWKQLTLYMPDDCNTLNPQRPSMFNAKQVMEFHLHLHFAVFPTTHNLGKTAEKQGKLSLRRYLESIMLTSEVDSLNQFNDITPRSVPAFASEDLIVSPAEEPHGQGQGLLLDTNLLNMTAASSITSPTTPFTRTREYAVYAGMVLVPDPQENVAFQALFQPQWMHSLKERLGQFLTLVSPNVEILPTMESTAANSTAGSVVGETEDQPARTNDGEDIPVAEVSESVVLLSSGKDEASTTPHSNKMQVRTYLEPAVGVTPAPSTGRLDDFEIAFTSPVNYKHGDGISSPLPSDLKYASGVPLSPIDLEVTTKMMEDVVSPLEMSPSEADVPRKRIVNAKINTKLAEETASLAKLTRIASPVSAVSSVISQLTDDDYPRSSIAAAAAALRAEENQVSAAQSSKSAEKKPKLKPFSSASRSAMQSQVDVYNKLLKRSASPKVIAPEATLKIDEENVPEAAPSTLSSSAVQPVSPAAPFRTTRRTTAATPAGQPRVNAAALNVGFGLKRRPASDAVAHQQVDQSLAAQVARYNKLLVSSSTTAPTATATAPSANANDHVIEQEQRQQESAAPASPLPSGPSEDTAEETLSASEAQRVEEVLLEMQQIYSDSTSGELVPGSTFVDVPGEKSPQPPVVSSTPLEQVEQKIDQHEHKLATLSEGGGEETQLVDVAE